MRAMVLKRIVSLNETNSPLELADLPTPEPAPNELRIRVTVCGVCHTELDEIEGRTAPPRLPIVLGHQVIGHVDRLGNCVKKWNEGDRVGVGWIHSSDGGPNENISSSFRATGRDVNGGYAEYITVPEDYAYSIPVVFADPQAAPLMCAGAIGYRSLRLTQLRDGQPLGLTGFGGSAHLVLQMARHRFPNSEIYVFARDPIERDFARQLGAVWTGDTTDRAPQQLQAIIDTTPAWKPVVEALANLRPGGRLVINAIRKEGRDQEALLRLDYARDLWLEKEIKSVANVTRNDVSEFLAVAAEISLVPETQEFPLAAANDALRELKARRIRGAKVLRVEQP